ncbi:hypothetical protein KIN20_007243 [Parelaphostrongylus tenuis]|uniref:Peptidase M12A domain-containing protein n=1 Tax=Parelaphostrongylus tenuis TaxID=148309 RepID=A0AAD5QJ04_PARTN|nr:hypothetical protein KIN20_007243 [Parelaphostrongylus tenuis]
MGCFSFVGKVGATQFSHWETAASRLELHRTNSAHALGFSLILNRDMIATVSSHFYQENIEAGYMDQMVKEGDRANYNYNVTYDYGSIMHYSAGR